MNNSHSDESENSEEGMKDENSDRKKKPAVPNRAGRRGAAHTAECPPPSQDRGTQRGQGVSRPAGQVGLPEGKPDRCNPDRCPAELTEGVIPR